MSKELREKEGRHFLLHVELNVPRRMQRPEEETPMQKFQSRLSEAREALRACDWSNETIVGKVEEFKGLDWNEVDADILIHGSDVLLLECHKGMHALIGAHLAVCMQEEIHQQLGMVVFDHGSFGDTRNWVNELGCHRVQNKIADLGLCMRDEFMDPASPRQVISGVVFEVAYRNESFGALLAEGAGWVNVHTDVNYAILVKITGGPESQYRFRLIIVQRTAGLPGRLEAIPEKCLQFPLVFPTNLLERSTAELQDMFGIRIVYDQSFSEEALDNPLPGIVLRSDLVLAGASTFVLAQASPHFVINLDSFRLRLSNLCQIMRDRAQRGLE